MGQLMQHGLGSHSRVGPDPRRNPLRLPLYAKGLMEPVLKGQSAVKWRHGGEQGGVGFLAC